MKRNLEHFKEAFKRAVIAKPLFIPIVTMEPHETLSILYQVAHEKQWKVFYWNQFELISLDTQESKMMNLGQVLSLVTNKELDGFIVIHGKAIDPRAILIQMLCNIHMVTMPIVLLTNSANIDPQVKAYSIILDYPLPNKEEIMEIVSSQITKQVETVDDKGNVSVQDIPVRLTEKAAEIALGLTSAEIKTAVSQIIAEKKPNKKNEIVVDYDEMKEIKEEIIRQESLISLEQPVPIDQVGGLDAVKEWLRMRKIAFERSDLEKPKGLLLLGIPGTGKSLFAKAIADYLNLPLVKFDIAAVFSKYVGESEARVREALKRVDAISRCVLWIDEIEKGIHGHTSTGDSGTSSRVVSTLLTWMQERDTREKAIFVVGTANIIEELPEYLIRKGRFDEIFFVDIPSPEEALEIFRIHCEKRNIKFDTKKIKPLCERKLIGAEIEEICKNATYIAANEGKKPTSDHVVRAAEDIVPMAVSHETSIETLRAKIAQYGIKPASTKKAVKKIKWAKEVVS